MPMLSLATAVALSVGPADLVPDSAPDGLQLTQAQPFIGTQGVVGPQGNYMTTAEGCTYRRTQAPGQPPRWIIVRNPHHIGKSVSPGKCKGML